MQAPPSSMEVDSPSAKGKKRTAEDLSPTTDTPRNELDNNTNAPRIVRRHHHRRRNVAAAIWGPDIAVTAKTPAANPSFAAPTQPFNIYKALLRHQNLFFQFALRLPYPTIIDLYAIDKEFHYRLNKYSVSLIHDYAKYHAPLAGFIFSWILYPGLCISDPMLRPMDGREWLARDVPGFRWVGMVLWRDKVVRSILTSLALEGHRVPVGTMGAVMKLWGVMEMRTNKMRQAFLSDREIWTDADLFNVQLFLVKLDMRFANPILGNGICALSHLLLTQRSLSTLWRVLTGTLKLDYDKATDMLVRTYTPLDLDTDAQPWLDDELDNGVPQEESGLLCREEWDVDGPRMQPVVDMLIYEGIQRGLDIQQHYLDFVLYGHVDTETGLNLPAPRLWRRDKGVVLPSKGWSTLAELKEMTMFKDQDDTQSVAEGEEMDTSS